MRPNIRDFLRWALPHAVLCGVSDEAVLPIPLAEVGTDPAHYLLGTIWMLCTRAKIKNIWSKQYADQYTWEEFDKITADWEPTSYATDCQGLNDAFFRFIWEGGDGVTDESANTCFKKWCSEKGTITDYKSLPLGAAVFKGSDSKKTHVGFICGYDGDEPLVLEAQGLKYGVRVNRLCDRPVFTYYGIMDKVYDYSDEAVYPDTPLSLMLESPRQSGDGYAAMQEALNLLGYKDNEGKPLIVDGKWGVKSREALEKLIVLNLGAVSADIILNVCDMGIHLTAEEEMI